MFGSGPVSLSVESFSLVSENLVEQAELILLLFFDGFTGHISGKHFHLDSPSFEIGARTLSWLIYTSWYQYI